MQRGEEVHSVTQRGKEVDSVAKIGFRLLGFFFEVKEGINLNQGEGDRSTFFR